MTEPLTKERDVSEIIAERVQHTGLGLTYTPETTFEEWLVTYDFYLSLKEKSLWMIGDCLRAGERFGDRYAQAVHIEDRSYSYLTTIASVCGRFEHARRRPGVSFGWHEAVAYLPPQTADHILDEAQRKHWTRDDIRDAAAKAQELPTREQKRKAKEQKKKAVVTTPAATIETQMEVTRTEFVEIVVPPVWPELLAKEALSRFVGLIETLDVTAMEEEGRKAWLKALIPVDKFIDALQTK